MPSWQNAALSPLEGADIFLSEDERTSLAKVQDAVSKFDPSGATYSSIQEISRTLSIHSKLKFDLPLALHVEIITLLERAYAQSDLSLPLKSKLLSNLRNLIRKKQTTNLKGLWEFANWRSLWNEAHSIVMRVSKIEVISSETVLSAHVTYIISYLHIARRFITSAKEIDDILALAMQKLQDTRTPACLQGLLMLVTLLPTNFSRYDEMLPQWVSVWNSIDHNACWDSCWLTLFTRARKHTKTFDWERLSGKFTLKARQMLRLPVVRGRSPSGSDFPNSFPAYYAKLLPNPGDPTKLALNKLSKIMYFFTLRVGGAGGDQTLMLTDPITLTPANIAVSVSAVAGNSFPGHNASASIRPGAVSITLFLQSIRTYLYPSNAGSWTGQLAYFLSCLVNEMARHVGRSMAFKLYGNSKEGYLGTFAVFEAPLHVPTVRFLSGTLTSIMMEGLYGRNGAMMNACVYGLRNLVGIDPSLGQIVVPFLLTALDSAAVNQSHQAPSALAALSVIVKPLFFPSPVMLKFLPDLLRLSLPGVDPNDPSKTCATLQMLGAVLAWLPLQTAYKAPPLSSYPPEYLSLTNQVDPDALQTPPSFPHDQKEIQSQLNMLAIAVQDWIPAFLAKIFALLESLEETKKGQRASPLISIIGETLGYFFQALTDPALRSVAEEKVLDFLKQNTPVNAGKAAGKILVSMVETNVSVLPRVLATLVDADVAAASCSPEKLAFRLRLVCGAVRCAQGDPILASLSTLQSLLSSNFFFHTEKKVRKTSAKLLKDVLRGATAVYPTNTTPITHPDAVIGAPNSTNQSLIWNAPSSEVLASMADVLRGTFVKSLKELEGIIEDIVTATEKIEIGAAEMLSAKKLEENIVQRLHILCKGLRGAAEVLGDGFCEIEIPATVVNAMAVDSSVSSDGSSTQPVSPLHTCASSLLSSLAPQDQELFSTLRSQSLRLLIRLAACLSDMPLAHVFVGLKHSAPIHKSWVKVVKIVTSQRMAFIKSGENVRKWFNMAKRVCRTIVVRTVQVGLKIRQAYCENFNSAIAFAERSATAGVVAGSLTSMSTVDYWKCHDISTNFLTQRVWLQHTLRLHEMGIAAMEATARTTMAPAYQECLRILTVLCGHEYDMIRQKAQDTFSAVATKFGHMRVMSIVKSTLLPTLVQTGTMFYQASGALVILQLPYVMRRITRDWSTSEQFLLAVNACPAMIAAVPEQDKREQIMNRLSDTFVKYSGSWCHLPFNGNHLADGLISTVLSTLGYDVAGNVVRGTESGPASTGLRYDAFAAFTLLHLIGHKDVPMPVGVWVWALRTLSSAHGEPSQLLALAALTRLITGAARGSKALFLSPEARATIRSLFADKAFLGNFLAGLSHAHPKASDDGMSAQWSRGVATLIHHAEFMRTVQPRSVTSIRYETNIFSRQVSIENAGLWLNLVTTGLLFSLSDANEGAVSKLETIAAVVAACKDALPKSSEGELKASNATRAEVFGGIMRALSTRPSGLSAIGNGDIVLMETALIDFFKETIEKVSMVYCRDWAEGLYFISAALHNNKSAADSSVSDTALESALFSAVLDDFSQLVGGDLSVTSSDEGFARQGKRLLLTKALLLGDVCATYSRGIVTASPVALSIVAIMQQAATGNLISSYRSSRAEVSSILCILSESMVGGELVFISQQMVELTTCVVDDGGADAPADVMSDTSLFTGGGAAGETPSESMAVDVIGAEAIGDANASDAAKSSPKAMLKCASETACGWLQGLSQYVPMSLSRAMVPDLLSVALKGSGHGEIEVAKACHDTVLLLVNSVQAGIRHEGDVLENVLRTLLAFKTHASWHIRETVQLSLGALLVSNWVSLSAAEKDSIKNALIESFHDVKPEVQQLGRAGLAAYLSFKTSTELKALADAYVRNSESLITREKSRRKAQSVSGVQVPKPDAKHVLTVNMLSCLILAMPYDILPDRTGSLLAALVAHSSVPHLADWTRKAILDFKRTHQDRMSEFKTFFSAEQWDAVAGASGASYLV